MHPIHAALYYYILESAILPYYRQTGYYQRREQQDQLEAQRCQGLTSSQQEGLEALQQAVSRTQDAELEAMFLAGLDCGLTLARGAQSCPRLAQK